MSTTEMPLPEPDAPTSTTAFVDAASGESSQPPADPTAQSEASQETRKSQSEGAGDESADPAAVESPPTPPIKIFLGGLSPSGGLTEEVLRAHFEQYGPVEEVVVKPPSGSVRGRGGAAQPRGYAFVSVRDSAAAEAIVSQVAPRDSAGHTPPPRMRTPLSRRRPLAASQLAQSPARSQEHTINGSVVQPMYAKSNYPSGFGAQAQREPRPPVRGSQTSAEGHFGPVYDSEGHCLKVFIGGLRREVTEETFRAFFGEVRAHAQPSCRDGRACSHLRRLASTTSHPRIHDLPPRNDLPETTFSKLPPRNLAATHRARLSMPAAPRVDSSAR
jgi:RNA-binding protein Musashi